MQSKNSALKFLATALAAMAFVLILVVSASVDAGNKNKNKGGGGGGGGGGHAQGCPPPLVKKGGGCVMPGGPKPAKNMQQQQRGQKHQQQVDRPRGQDRKQVNKPLENPKQGKSQGDKRQAGPKGDGGKQQAGPKGDGGKKFGDYLKDKDRDRDGGNKAAGDDKKDGKDPDRPGLGDHLKDKDRGRPDDGKHADDKDKGGKDHDGDGEHAGDDKDDKDGKDGKGHDDDGKHAGEKYPGGKHDDGKHDGKGGHKGPVMVDCKHPYVWKRGKGCVRPGGHDQAYCGWPMVRIGNSCVCGPGFISRHGDCYRPPVVVVVPGGPGYVPDGPGYVPVGPEPDYPDGPPPGAGPGGPPDDYPPQEASPASPPRQPVEPVALVDPASNARCLPQDLYDLLEETYGKRPSLDRCPAACLPKPASFTEAELDAAAEKSGINWCDNCVQVGGYMPLASVLKLERAANITLCVNPDMCRLPASIGGPASGGEKVTEIRTIFKDLPAGTKNEGNIAVIVGNKDYQGDLPDNPDGSADADAVMALLVDQLGYKQENIIDLRDATLEDLRARVRLGRAIRKASLPGASTRRTLATCSSMSQATAW